VTNKKSGPFHFVAYNVYITHILKISTTYLQYLKQNVVQYVHT